MKNSFIGKSGYLLIIIVTRIISIEFPWAIIILIGFSFCLSIFLYLLR